MSFSRLDDYGCDIDKINTSESWKTQLTLGKDYLERSRNIRIDTLLHSLS